MWPEKHSGYRQMTREKRYITNTSRKHFKIWGFLKIMSDAADSVLDECKVAAEKRLKRKNSRLDKCGIPEEQLYLMQQELIAKARRDEAEKQAAAQMTEQAQNYMQQQYQQQLYQQQMPSTSGVPVQQATQVQFYQPMASNAAAYQQQIQQQQRIQMPPPSVPPQIQPVSQVAVSFVTSTANPNADEDYDA
ncbi:hypothetical protein M3Y97_01017000 [Aphelenchoides bicaudatus]|nr:hypothetical protein M3Y97_01017000 [Aphelenchoides bicaudatus]